MLGILILLGLAYLLEQKQSLTADKDYTKQLIPDTSKISNEISVDLEKKILVMILRKNQLIYHPPQITQ